MSATSPEEAVARARAETGMGPSVPARAWHVRRLDVPEDDYYLVVFGEDRAAVAVAMVGAARGEVQARAALPGHGPHLTLGPGEAAERAGLAGKVQAQLVWRPCRASRSPLYPLWELRTADRTVYVDQAGAVWPELALGGRGG